MPLRPPIPVQPLALPPVHARPSLLIADDDPVVRAVLSAQLEPDFRLVGPASDADEAIMLAGEHQPDAALIDVDMPGGGAPRAVPRILAGSPSTRLVVLSGDERPEVLDDLYEAGAVGFIQKGFTGFEIAQTLMAALHGAPALTCPGTLRTDRLVAAAAL